MEILITTIKFILIIILIFCPFLILIKLHKQNSNYSFAIYLILSAVTTFILVLVLAWWSHYSCQLLLSHFGYDNDAWSDLEKFKNITSENLNKVKEIDKSRMGIGWPLKAFIFYPFYFLYLLIVYVTNNFIKNLKQKTN